VLADWLPSSGLVLEIASGSGEHAVHFASRFPNLQWQPSDRDLDALNDLATRQSDASLPNLRPPMFIDAAASQWDVDQVDAIVSINMVHIAPPGAALGLLDGAGRLLAAGRALILYGPWLQSGVPTAPSNLAFDQDLRARDPRWGLRHVEAFAAEARDRGFALDQIRTMPANNLMLLFRRV
jgi:hypothetical protein